MAFLKHSVFQNKDISVVFSTPIICSFVLCMWNASFLKSNLHFLHETICWLISLLFNDFIKSTLEEPEKSVSNAVTILESWSDQKRWGRRVIRGMNKYCISAKYLGRNLVHASKWNSNCAVLHLWNFSNKSQDCFSFTSVSWWLSIYVFFLKKISKRFVPWTFKSLSTLFHYKSVVGLHCLGCPSFPVTRRKNTDWN